MLNSAHYLQNIMALAEKRQVLTHTPLWTEQHIKLLDQGVHVSPALYDKLLAHRLLAPLEECLSVADPVTPAALAMAAGQVLDAGLLGRILAGTGERAELLEVFAGLPLLPQLAFKLTLLREQLPEVFRHSLEVAICALLLARRAGYADRHGWQQAVAAGLFHDLGLLHIAPELLAGSGELRQREWQHIYSHPVTAHLVLSRCREWHPQVSQAVLEHHERLDGSGYPRGVGAERISPLGSLLAMAELMSSLLHRAEMHRVGDLLHVVLRLNHGKFNRQLSATLAACVGVLAEQAPPGSTAGGPDYSHILGQLVELSAHIMNWRALAPHFGELPLAVLISQRLDDLDRNLAALGIDLQYWSMIDAELSQDQQALAELAIGVAEANWQLRAIALEVWRKWDALRPENASVQQEIWRWVSELADPG